MTTAEQLTLALGGKWRGQYGSAHCPGSGHRRGDKHASLSIAQGQSQDVVWYCHAGCDWREVLDYFLREGLLERKNGQAERQTTNYEIRDERGVLLRIHQRVDHGGEKQFYWFNPATGEWRLGIKSEMVPLYNVHRLREWTDGPLILAEGEKATDALLRASQHALGTVCGAASTPSLAVLKPLTGRQVILWPDHDAPGDKHMKAIAPILHNLGCDVRWFDWLDAPDKGDAHQYVVERGLVLPEWSSLPRWGAAEDEYEILPGVDMMVTMFKPKLEVVPAMLSEGLALLVGPTKIGKSRLALSLGIEVSLGGVAFGGVRVEQGEVLYISLEDGPRRVQERAGEMLKGRTFPEESIAFAFKWPRFDKGGIERLERWLDQHPKTRIVVADVWARLKPKGEHGRNIYDMEYEMMEPLHALANKYRIVLLILHHFNKLRTDDPLDSVSGSTALVGAVDTLWIFRRERGQADASLLVTGRDVMEREYALRAKGIAFELLGDAHEYRLSSEREQLLEAIAQEPGQKPAQLAQLVRRNTGAIRKLLFGMVRAGQVRVRGGGYYPALKRFEGSLGNYEEAK